MDLNIEKNIQSMLVALAHQEAKFLKESGTLSTDMCHEEFERVLEFGFRLGLAHERAHPMPKRTTDSEPD
jgi:hypothetical protein